ncbi:MAG TPA: tRNA (adenosine(37)-N6)-threonylcarbamoyltransferase complex dimerization subunit type 1 TsaB [Phycisphaerae bacterium]|nr:tRNA (adenosine(37)-N6)-threonylcarbamoyltransferase complex dimerization subunit type 1 TsaB [Phycisphaerae bacterium]HRR85527.1 tRNA (adenosine(37)-N6)-threonylcarbamoyltransferase complex dimerization subunit type 1 TsaB [Phycisphaerae bacterium]
MSTMYTEACRILAIETSGRSGSVALATGGGQIVAAAGPLGVHAHASELMPAVERMLAGAGWPGDSLTDVFVSIGPGSFTGLRVGVTVARTLSWAVGARVVAVPTLECLACNALSLIPPPMHLAVILDAKSGRVFCEAFELRNGWYAPAGDTRMDTPQAFLARCPRPLAVLGEGIAHHRQAITESGAMVLDSGLWGGKAENVVRVGVRLAEAGRYTPGGDLLPCYVRRPDPEEKWEKLHREP